MVYPFTFGQTILATEAAWCAQDQGKFFEYQHALFENQGQIEFTESELVNLAATLGLDQVTFGPCLSTGQHRSDIEAAHTAASNRGVNSTPTFFIGNQQLKGNRPYEDFQRAINQELARSSK